MKDRTPYLTKVSGRDAWHIRDGEKRLTTGETDRSAATAVLLEYLRKRASTSAAPVTSKPRAGTVADIMRIWLSVRERKNPHTMKKWTSVAGTLDRHAGHVALAIVGCDWADGYARARYREGVEPSTVRQELQSLLAAWKVARKSGATDLQIPELELPPAGPCRDFFLTREEADRLVAACTRPHLKLFTMLALDTGGRPGAILELTWSRVDLATKRVDLRAPSEEGRGRRKPAARVPLGDAMVETLRAAREVAVTDFVIEHAGRPVESVKIGFRSAVIRAGLDPDLVTPHVLRHSAATWMAQDGVPMREISGFLGHTTVAVTEQIYAHHHPDFMRAARRSLDRK